MTKVLEKPSPLRRLRDAMNGGTGMTAKEAAARLAVELGEETRTGESIVMIERRGTNDVRILRALAVVYGRTFEEVERAASK